MRRFRVFIGGLLYEVQRRNALLQLSGGERAGFAVVEVEETPQNKAKLTQMRVECGSVKCRICARGRSELPFAPHAPSIGDGRWGGWRPPGVSKKIYRDSPEIGINRAPPVAHGGFLGRGVPLRRFRGGASG